MRPLAAPIAAFALIAGTVAAAAAVVLDGPLVQGGMVRGTAPPGSVVRLAGRALRVSPEGRFVFGFGRDAPPEARLEVQAPGGPVEVRLLKIAPRRYDIQRIDGLPEHMVTPSAAELARIHKEAEWIREVRARDTDATWFLVPFAWPAKGRISGVYGSQRVLNGKPRRPHYGVDIAAPVGTPVRAPAPGRVALAEKDLFYTGGTVMIDHGYGITSVLSHMSRVDVAVGDRLAQGDLVGAVGATGRVTGPHLDWRVNWFAERLDPALLVGPMSPP